MSGCMLKGSSTPPVARSGETTYWSDAKAVRPVALPVPPTRLARPSQQILAYYPAQDRTTWKTLVTQQLGVLAAVLAPEFVRGMETLHIGADHTPEFARIEARLQPLTGWSLLNVVGRCPEAAHFGHLARRTLAVTSSVRPQATLGEQAEPDMFLDVFGHVPLLAHQPYAEFLRGLGALAVAAAHDAVALARIARLYAATIEHGLVRNGDCVAVYGGRIVTSHAGAVHAMGPSAARRVFDVRAIMACPQDAAVLPATYWVIDSFAQLLAALPAIAAHSAG